MRVRRRGLVMLNQRSNNWGKVAWFAGLGATLGGPLGYWGGEVLWQAGHEGAIAGSLLAAMGGSFLGRPDSVALGYVAGLIGAGSYLLGGLMGVIAYAWILDGLSPTGTTVSAVVGSTWLALLVPWVLTRGPFPGLGPEPRR